MLEYLKGGAILGVIVGFWDKIKLVGWKVISIAIQRVEIKTDDAHNAVIAYLVKNYKKYQTYDKSYGAINETFRNGKYGLVPFEKFGSSSIIFQSDKKVLGIFRMPFLFNHTEESKAGDEERNYNREDDRTYSSITFLRRTLDIDKIIKEATEFRNSISWQIDDTEESTTRFDIFYLPNKDNNNHAYFSKDNVGYAWYKQNQYRLLGIEANDLGREMSSNGKALDNLFFPQEVKELIDIISLWVKSKDWYKEKNIPWKRGWLLYGPPGTGKTALVRAFAEDLNMPIYVFSLSQMSNNDLMSSWKNMQLNVPCIALIEDIDNVFHGRKNICQNTGMIGRLLSSDEDNNQDNDDSSMKFTPLTFDCLLNCIDGVDKSNGVFTIITTNDITKIDSAIGQPIEKDGTKMFVSSRPGRIDKAIELTYMQKENKIQLANKILNEFPQKLQEVMQYIELEHEETPAQFQEYCAQIAIQEYWKQKINDIKVN